MISAISGKASAYRMPDGGLPNAAVHPAQLRLKAPGEAGGAPVDAAVANGMTQGLARGISRGQAPHGKRAQASKPQYVGPARAAGRSTAYGLQRGAGINLERLCQDLLAGRGGRRGAASAAEAEGRYLEARGILG